MSTDADSRDLICGCPGCRESAALVIRHPTKGQRTVCDGHAGDYEVIRRAQ